MNILTNKQKVAPVTPSKKTLDTQHNNKLTEFQEKAELLTTLKSKYNSVLENIMELENRKRTQVSLSKEEHDTLIKYIDERDELRRHIDDIEANDDEIEYLVNTAPILFKYYDIIEKGNDDDLPSTKLSENSVLKWFVKNKTNEDSNGKNKEDRASLLERYLSYTDDNFSKTVESESCSKCQNCNSGNLNIQLNDGILYCNECSCVEYIIVDHERPSYKDPPREISYFAYKRKMMDALKSHMPKTSEHCLWENIYVLRILFPIIVWHEWLVLL